MKEEEIRLIHGGGLDRNGRLNGNSSTTTGERPFDPHPDSSLANQAQPAFEPVLDSEEAAALLRIHPKTLQRMARHGEIPGFRIGKLWAFRASALNQWLENKMAS